jgi:hypothetical protein
MIEEAEPGLFDRSPRLQGIAERFRATLPVRIAAGTNVMDPERPYRILGPNGADHRLVGEWVETLRDGVVVERQRLSPSARFLRRAILRFQAWRLVRQTRPRSWA